MVHTADHGTCAARGRVRTAGEPESGDPAVDEAADGITGALALLPGGLRASVVRRAGASGGRDRALRGRDYVNAFWNGAQLVFGDGDGEVFDRFTGPSTCWATSSPTRSSSTPPGWPTEGQSGALNESVSDVFAACLKQRLLGQSAAEADWLIGVGHVPARRPGARAARHGRPGTAYDDPVLGTDPQPAHMDDYVDTVDDNGGVHLNSGIPNRAFHLAATAIGGSSAEGAGRIWYAALTGGQVGARTDFAGFAAATVAAAGDTAPPWRRRGRRSA